MLRQSELDLVYLLREEYEILICNAHDVHLQSKLSKRNKMPKYRGRG